MIPKILHYVWFGGKEKPAKVVECINSWKEHLKDYEFVEWNESNFDVSQYKFTQQAYDAKKWAFVSDVVRLYALYNVGGIYLDTDVMVYKNLDEFLHNKAFSGFEQIGYPVCATMGAEKGNPIIKEMLDYYNDREFVFDYTNWHNNTTNTMIMADILGKNGINRTLDTEQGIENFTVYPRKTFMIDYTQHLMLGSWG